jgi:putative flippase GtrA
MRLRILNLNPRYLIIGVWNTCFGVGSFLLISDAFRKLDDLIILTLSYFLSIIQSHLTQRIFVWKSKGKYFPELARFSTAYIAQYFVNILLLVWTGKISEFSRETRQGCIIILLALVMYVINKRGVFRVYN